MERPTYRIIKFPAKNFRQIRESVVRRDRRERKGEKWEGNERRRREGSVDSNSQQAMIRPGKLVFLMLMKRKESCERAGRGRGRKREIERERSEGGGVSFFKGNINSLSALVVSKTCVIEYL